MATSYVDAEELAKWARIDDNEEEPYLHYLAESTKTAIDAYCGWSFELATTPVTLVARVFRPRHSHYLIVDPFKDDTDLVVKTDTSGDGTFETTWASTDFQLEPLNQIRSGQANHPYFAIRAIESRGFPGRSGRATVEVTADWGWPAVPQTVASAAFMHATRLHERRNFPAALAQTDAGTARTAMGLDTDVKTMLNPFVNPRKWVP